MPGEPAETAFGVAALGFGVILCYAALKDVEVFGLHGIIPTFLRTGKFVDIGTLPRMGTMTSALSKKTTGT